MAECGATRESSRKRKVKKNVDFVDGGKIKKSKVRQRGVIASSPILKDNTESDDIQNSQIVTDADISQLQNVSNAGESDHSESGVSNDQLLMFVNQLQQQISSLQESVDSGRDYVNQVNQFSMPASAVSAVSNAFTTPIANNSDPHFEVISSPMTAGVLLHRSVSQELVKKIVSNKFIELNLLLDTKFNEHNYLTLKSKETDEGVIPIWSPVQTKVKPLSLVQWVKAFNKYASVYSNAFPGTYQQLMSYMFNVMDIAENKGDWHFYDRQFRKDHEHCDYSFSAHRVDLYTKAMYRMQGKTE